MDRAAAAEWAVGLLSGSLVDTESSRDPPALPNPLMRVRARAFRVAFPDLYVVVHKLTIDGEWVSVHAIGRAHHLAVFQGCPPTGRAWSAACTAMFQVSDDQIVDGWLSWDLLSILEQLGAVERSVTVSA